MCRKSTWKLANLTSTQRKNVSGITKPFIQTIFDASIFFNVSQIYQEMQRFGSSLAFLVIYIINSRVSLCVCRYFVPLVTPLPFGILDIVRVFKGFPGIIRDFRRLHIREFREISGIFRDFRGFSENFAIF